MGRRHVAACSHPQGWRIRSTRALSVGLAAVLAAAVVTSCSGSPVGVTPLTRMVSVAPGVTVQLPASSVAVLAKADPRATASLTKPVRVGGRNLASAIAVLAAAQHLSATGPLPASGVVLSFRVNPRKVPAGTTPFLASLDTATGKWVPVASRYDPATGEVSARVTHFSIWAPLDWVRSRIAALFKGALLSLFGLAGTGTAPSCSGDRITVTDSRPHAGIGACAQADGAAKAVAKIVDERPYPVDVLYPVGADVEVPSADPFAQLGEDITNLVSNWHDRVLLSGGVEADSTVALAAGQQTGFITEPDGEALLLGILGTAIRMLVKISGGLAITTAKTLLDLLDQANCLREAAHTADTASLSLATAQSIGSAAFDCVSAVAQGVSDVIFTVASIASALAVELVSSIWGAIDSWNGNAYHELTLRRPELTTVYIAEDQYPYGSSPLYRPTTVELAGDGTYELSDMTWSTWSSTAAIGTGTALIDDCTPSCAGGRFYHVPVVAIFSKPVKACKAQYDAPATITRYFWSQVDLTYPSGLPAPVQGSYGLWVFSGLIITANQSCG
jgi:hypothetical protein